MAFEENPMSTPQRLNAKKLSSELSKLPSLTASTSSNLDPVRIALARAVASGQNVDQLSVDLGVPASWKDIALSKPPLRPDGPTSRAPASDAAAPRLAETIKAAPPDWIAKIVPLALAKNITTRVVVLDREPTALGGLERPAWARALSPSATYGPFTSASGDLQIKALKWIQVFNFTETVEFVRAGSVLCVLPLSIFHFGTPTKAGIVAGSAWIAVHPFVSSAPADSFAGITIQSGEITSDQPLGLGPTVVNIPAGATINLELMPAPSAAGSPGSPAIVTAPGKISITFPPSGPTTISFDSCSATLYSETISCSPANNPATYDPNLHLLYVPGHSSEITFKPTSVAGKLINLQGSAPIESAGWAFNVSESATPATLGSAANSGDFAIVLGPGISSKWMGLSRPEPAASGVVLAQNSALLLYLISGAAPGVLNEQQFKLWDDQDSSNKRRCQLVAARAAGQVLMYAIAGADEIIELGAALEALVDRPLLATGARVPALFGEGVVGLIHNNAGYQLVAYSATPAGPGPGLTGKNILYPLALDNAFLEVTQPLALLISAKTDAHFNAIDGLFFLLFGYFIVELYLPDPYTGGLFAGGERQNPTLSDVTAQRGASSGYLVAEVVWPSSDKATLRLADTAHAHPATAPTSEASSTAVPPPHYHLGPVHMEPAPLALRSKVTKAASTAISDRATHHPPPSPPLPAPDAGAMLLDLSTRASQLGVEVVLNRQADLQYTIDGLSVRGPASLLPLTTLPAIAWEPMYNRATGTANAGVSNFDLLHPPGDGPFTQVRSTSATLIPISPLQSLQAVLNAGKGGFTAQLTLPFGMVAVLDSTTVNGTILPELNLVRPTFPAASTPSGSIYTGAWQLSFAAPDSSQPDPVLAGRTYLRTQSDNPTPPALSYGEQVLGTDVKDIFSSRFDPPAGSKIGTGVPLRRYDLTGYGASTFSEWTNMTPASTDVIKAFFHVLIGRTSHEVIQVQSIICPWAIKVVRTITIDREASGSVQRYDSGWQAASDGLFYFPASTGITANQIHSGLISGVINVKNIQELGFPGNTQGTQDGTGFGGTPAVTMTIPVQPVTFDADVIIQPQHQVVQGGENLPGLDGQMHVCVPSKGVTGFIGLQFDYHLSISDMANFDALSNGAGGAINATLNVGGANSILRATEFDATPVDDGAVAKGLGIACAVRGLPKLSSDGSWSVASRGQTQAAPVALSASQSAPVVQPNKSGGTTPGKLIHFADPADIFRLDPGFATPPQTLYGFLQATGTQSNFLSRPMLTVGSQELTLADALNVAHAGALLGAISNFPGISQCLQFLGGELDKITNQLAAPSLSTTQNLQLKPGVRSTPLPLISTSIADVNLYFHQKDEDLTKPADPANVVISLGQPTSPSWSLDVNHIAVGLVVPALSADPIIWLQGAFHADADTTPAFPDLKVVFDGPLEPLTQFFTILQDIASVLSPGGGASAGAVHAHDDGSGGGAGLNVHFSDGKLSVTDNFQLPSIPLGPGTIEDVSLNIGTTLNILGLSIDFLVSIGTPDAPCHWIVDPLSGTVCIQAGVLNNAMDILIQGGIGLGLAIDLGIASGSASIVIAVQIQINGEVITLMLLLTGQAQVNVLGGLASASITLTAGLGFSIDLGNADIDLIGTASVGIHISICWVVNISWSGSWTFEKELPLKQIA
jgi:hypothetical protein